MRLFGKAKTAPSVQDSIGKLKEVWWYCLGTTFYSFRHQQTLDLLEKREEYLNARIGKEVKFARDNAQKNRKVHLMLCTRKIDRLMPDYLIRGRLWRLSERGHTSHKLQNVRGRGGLSNNKYAYVTDCLIGPNTHIAQMMAIENAHVSQEAMAAMRSGAATMRSINRNMYSLCLLCFVLLLVVQSHPIDLLWRVKHILRSKGIIGK